MIKRLLATYINCMNHKKIARTKIVKTNQISALINLLNLLVEPVKEEIEMVLDQSVPKILDSKPNIENFCFLLDSVSSLE